jgi:hypothetical protein
MLTTYYFYAREQSKFGKNLGLILHQKISEACAIDRAGEACARNYLLDVDASFDEDSLRGATGAVIRESKGQFVAASNRKVEHVVDALSAKHKL